MNTVMACVMNPTVATARKGLDLPKVVASAEVLVSGAVIHVLTEPK